MYIYMYTYTYARGAWRQLSPVLAPRFCVSSDVEQRNLPPERPCMNPPTVDGKKLLHGRIDTGSKIPMPL